MHGTGQINSIIAQHKVQHGRSHNCDITAARRSL